VLNLKASAQAENLDIFQKWQKKHRFWYETLPNKIYDECLEKHSNSKDGLGAPFGSDDGVKASNGAATLFTMKIRKNSSVLNIYCLIFASSLIVMMTATTTTNLFSSLL
jgi:hypothetical protein